MPRHSSLHSSFVGVEAEEVAIINEVERQECPGCGTHLLVPMTPGTLETVCACGRRVTSEELKSLLREWEERVGALGSLSADARSKGLAGVGDVIDRRLRILIDRIHALRNIVNPSD